MSGQPCEHLFVVAFWNPRAFDPNITKYHLIAANITKYHLIFEKSAVAGNGLIRLAMLFFAETILPIIPCFYII